MLEVRVKRKLKGFNLDVNFSIDQEILAILGPSGSGKTMTLHCMAGLLRPDEGFIKLNHKVLFDSAKNICLPPQSRKIGLVFQNFALFPHLTVSQNIAYGINDRPKRAVAERVAQLMEKMNIQRLGERYPRQLSAGQQQRAAVARALAPEPDLLLLDEPFSALDSMVKERLQLELQTLQSFYTGNVLFVTHDLTEGYKLSSKMAVFESGHIVQLDDKAKVISCPSNHTVARLIGVKNLMEGLIMSLGDTEALVKVPELGGLLKAKSSGYSNLSVGQEVTIGIRPEYIRLAECPGENTFSCTVDRVVEGVSSANNYFHVDTVGPTRHYLLAILSNSNSSRLAAGDSRYLYLAPEHIALISNFK
jgi:molybdate transport system ATP-binding protein